MATVSAKRHISSFKIRTHTDCYCLLAQIQMDESWQQSVTIQFLRLLLEQTKFEHASVIFQQKPSIHCRWDGNLRHRQSSKLVLPAVRAYLAFAAHPTTEFSELLTRATVVPLPRQ